MKKLILLILIFTIAVQFCTGKTIIYTKTGTRTSTSTEANPTHVSGNTYKGSDGTDVELKEGQSPTDPSSYGEHGMPTKEVTTTTEYTYTITMEIPDNVYIMDIKSLLEDTKEYCDKKYKESGDKKVEISFTREILGTEKFDWQLSRQVKVDAAVTGTMKIKSVTTSIKEINQSNSVQIGDPVLMTSGQYRYDETDMTITAGNAVLELGRHYQSDSTTGDSIGKNWFLSLDSRIILGTSVTAETEYEDLARLIADAEKNLNTLIKQRAEAERAYNDDIKAVNDDIDTITKTITDLSHNKYSNEPEVQKYITDYTKTKKLFQDYVESKTNEKNSYLSELDSLITETRNRISEQSSVASELKKIADHSVYNRNRNTATTKGFGFSGHEDIGTKVIFVYDTNGRKSMYQVTTDAKPTPNGTGNPYPNGAETKSLSGGTDTLSIKSDGSYKLTKKDGTYWLYGADGLLRSITDRNGNCISLEYENGKPSHIFRNGIKAASIEWKNGRITAVLNARDNTDRTEYFYNLGIISAVKDNEGDTIFFGYTDDGMLGTITKPDGSTVLIDYNLSRNGQKLVGRTKNEEDFWETFSYNQNGKKVEHKSHSGTSTVYEYDDSMRLTKETSADGTIKEYAYDEDSNIILEKQNGNSTTYAYDSDGNKLRANFSDGSFETWTYDSFGQITSYKDRDNVSYEYIRDSKGNLIAVRTGGKTLSSYSYDSKGNLTSVKSYRADGTTAEQHLSYDIYGNLTERTSGGANSTANTAGAITERWTYDNRGRPLTYSINEETEETYAYDGKKTTVTTRSGLVSEYVTNSRKDCVSIKETDTVTGETRFTSIEYDKIHMPIRRTLSAEENEQPVITAEYKYLPGGEPEAELISDGKDTVVTLYGYKDSFGKNIGYVTEIRRIKCTPDELSAARIMASPSTGTGFTGSAGSGSFSGTDNHSGSAMTISKIDLEKLWLTAADKYSISYRYENTATGTKVTTISPDGTQTITEYDSWSRPISMTDAAGISSKLEFSPAGRIKKQQSPYGGFTEYRYDGAGNLTGTGREGSVFSAVTTNPDGTPFRVTDSSGRTTEYTYDSIGNLTKITTPAGSRYMTYDNNGRLILSVTGGNGSIQQAEEYTSYEYGEDGRNTSITRGGLYPVSYTTNAWGETISATDGEGNTQNLSYDCAGRVVSTKDAYGRLSSYEYNVMGLVTKAMYPDGTFYEYRYDIFGNTTETLFCGKTTWRGQYNKSGHLVEQDGELSVQSSYQYDSTGKITGIFSNGENLALYDYSDRGKSVQSTDASGNISTYTYDDFGTLISETDKSGRIKSYTYNDAGELSQITQFSGKTVSYSTSSDGMTRTTIYEDGNSDIISYNLSGRIKSIRNNTGEIRYEYDKGGMLIRQTDGTADGTVIYSYDKAGRKIRIMGAGRNIELSYGKNGEVLQIRDHIAKTGFKIEYDSMMRETRRTADNGIRKETSYNRNGTVDRIIVKDRSGIVISAEAYVYSEDGRKEATINGNGDVTLFEYDEQGRLSVVLYPDTAEIREREAKTISDYGITDFRYNPSESRYLSKKVYEKIAELQKLCHNINGMIPTYRSFRSQKFAYDKNGNRTHLYIGGGLLEYQYDKDNRLTECRTGGKTVRTYSYDADGNLVGEADPSEAGFRAIYEYGGNGRMISSVTKAGGFDHEQRYSYDALGRRVSAGSREEGFFRTVYDGFGFEPLVEVRAGTAGTLDDNASGKIPQGERYRYITDDVGVSTSGVNGSGRAAQKDDKKVNYTAGFRTRTTLYVGGNPAALCTDGESLYLSCDDIGSVSLVTDDSGSLIGNLSYDAFGTPFADTDSDYDTGWHYGKDVMLDAVISRAAYAGKPYDKNTGLYDYGFRDYSPSLARFTTVDPIQDGTNWYAYCNSDPVNFVDKWGLDQIAINGQNVMQDEQWRNTTITGSADLFRNAGCAILAVSNMLSIAPTEVNDKYVKNGCVQWDSIAKDYGYTVNREYNSLTKDILEEQMADSDNNYRTLVNVNYDQSGHDHWVGVKGFQTIGDTDYVVINPTSINDRMTTYDSSYYYNNIKGSTYYPESRSENGWMVSDGSILVPMSETKGYVNFVEKKKGK